jgi:hypothetical protein
MRTIAIALAATLALSGAAFAKDASDASKTNANIKASQASETFQGKRFIDPTATGSISDNQDVQGKRLGVDVNPWFLPTAH